MIHVHPRTGENRRHRSLLPGIIHYYPSCIQFRRFPNQLGQQSGIALPGKKDPGQGIELCRCVQNTVRRIGYGAVSTNLLAAGVFFGG